MGLIKNFNQLSATPERKTILELVEVALESIQPEHVIQKNIWVDQNTLKIQNNTYNFTDYENIYLIGFGKGSARMSRLIEEKLGNKLSEGYVIDVTEEKFSKITFTLGTHPLPSQENFQFTKKLIDRFEGRLSAKDLVLIVICGGGSAMLVAPYRIPLEKMIDTNKALLKSGADIYQMNTVRKHLSQVKGGGLAKILNPAMVASLIFSDVPGNDLSVIASGPTVKDATSIDDAWSLIEKFGLINSVPLTKEDLSETPKDDQYFQNVSNILVLSNMTALNAMKEKAESKGAKVSIYSDHMKEEASKAGQELLKQAKNGEILLAGGETTVKVTTKGVGGRNQHLVLSTLLYLDEKTTVCSFDSDGWDNSPHAGALVDMISKERAQELSLDPNNFLEENNSFDFFQKIGDAIITDRLSSNVSDLMIVLKK